MIIQPWQMDILNKMSQYKGRGLIQITGRQMGKSAFSAQALKRMMDDINNRPVEDLVLTENRVHGARYHCVEPVGGNWREMEAWCFKQFGDVGNNIGWAESEHPQCYRWYMNNRKFWFRNESDRTMFVLKWR